jgi:hypothetical protein
MAGVGAEGQPAAVLADARRRRPWWPRLRRGEGAVGAKGGRGSFGRRSRSRGRAQAVAIAGGKWNSTAAVSMAWRHGHGQCRRLGAAGGSAHRGRSSGPLLRRHARLLATAGSTVTCLGAGAGLGRTRGSTARARPAVCWTPSGRPTRGSRRGGIQGLSGRAEPRETRGTDA